MALVCVLFWDVGSSSPLRNPKTHHQLCDLPRSSRSLHRVSVSISQPKTILLLTFSISTLGNSVLRPTTLHWVTDIRPVLAQHWGSNHEDHRFSLGNSNPIWSQGGETNVIMMHRGSPSMVMQATSKTTIGGDHSFRSTVSQSSLSHDTHLLSAWLWSSSPFKSC